MMVWGVLADWLAERDYQAEHYCRRIIALKTHDANLPRGLPRGPHNRGRRQEANRLHREARLRLETEYGPVERGDYANRPHDVLWILWGDPSTPRDVRAELFLHHCRTTGSARALVGCLVRPLPRRGGTVYTAALDVLQRYCEGRDIPARRCDSPSQSAISEEGHYTTTVPGKSVAKILDAIYTANPIAALFGSSEQRSQNNSALFRPSPEDPEDALVIEKNPFPAPR